MNRIVGLIMLSDSCSPELHYNECDRDVSVCKHHIPQSIFAQQRGGGEGGGVIRLLAV